MIPSDHFTRFYNEVFKFLETKGNEVLHAYWLEISRNQERHTMEAFRADGLRGMRDYWDHIRIEENCDLDLELHEDRLELNMNACPSLRKVMDNDANPMSRYCDHCAGWIGPIMDKLGYHLVYDGIDRQEPRCKMQIFKDRDQAREAEGQAKLLMDWPGKSDGNKAK
jgi:hypothetical protein